MIRCFGALFRATLSFLAHGLSITIENKMDYINGLSNQSLSIELSLRKKFKIFDKISFLKNNAPLQIKLHFKT